MKKVYADQGYPYKLMRNKFFRRGQYKDLISIVNKNIAGITPTEIIELFKKIDKTGCSCAMFANCLVDQIHIDNEEFKSIFGFSLYSENKIDCNKLMVDIFSKLYSVMKIRFIEYEVFCFNTIEEASMNLLGKTFNSEQETLLELFNNGIIPNGRASDGKLLFKSRNPKITSYVGTCEQVAKEKFGIVGLKNLTDLKQICKDKNIEIECKDIEIYEKLTGLTTENFNYWSNYYLSQYMVDFKFNNEFIIVSDFKEDYDSFVKYIEKLILDGYSISVAATPNSIAYMHTSKNMSWSKISSEKAGHVMLFKEFNNSNDIVVSSYGQDYIIPKEYFIMLEFKKIKKNTK